MIGFGQGRDRAERLLALSCVLQLGRPLRLVDLRDRFGLYADGDEQASRRKFERDKADLRALGIDIDTVTVGGNDAYRIPTGPPPITIGWTGEEALALAALAAAVGDEVTGGALAKASVHTGDYPAEDRRVRIRLQLDASPTLTDAVARHRQVRFRYRTATATEADRTVEPWALATRRGLSYVTGFDLDRDDGRAFRIDRILGEVTDVGQATHPRPASGLGVPLAPPDRSTVRLAVTPSQLPDALAMGATVVDDTNDRVEVELADVRDETAIGWILRHQATVLAPDTIAAVVADRRARIATVHTGEPSRPPLRPARSGRRTRRVGLSDQRLTRLLALPEWLATRPGVTIEEIATAFGCTVDEVEAELDLIDWLEIPKLGFVGELAVHDNGQISFIPTLSAPRADLTTVEAVHLLSLVEAAQALLPTTAVPALAAVAQRLRAVLPDTAALHQAGLADHPHVSQLRDLVGTDTAVRFVYHGRRDDTAVPRRCIPLQLQLIGGALYLTGHDLDRDGDRVFRVDRMSELTVPATAAGTYDADPVTTDPVYIPVDDEVEAELLLSRRAVWILTLIEPTTTDPLPDGHVHATVHTDVPEWLLAHVRAAGGEAELLRPSDLRARLQDA